MGALLRIAYDIRQQKLKPIAHGVRVFSLFRRDGRYEEFEAVLSVEHEGQTVEFSTLFVGDVTVKNRSTSNFPEFEFGVAVRYAKCVHVAWEDPDQHHTITLIDEVNPSEPRSKLRFRLHPFNRRDSYSLRLYLSPNSESEKPEVHAFSSPQAVRFVDEPAAKDGALRRPLFWIAVAGFLASTAAYLSASYGAHSARVERLREREQVQQLIFKEAANCQERGGYFDISSLKCVEPGADSEDLGD